MILTFFCLSLPSSLLSLLLSARRHAGGFGGLSPPQTKLQDPKLKYETFAEKGFYIWTFAEKSFAEKSLTFAEKGFYIWTSLLFQAVYIKQFVYNLSESGKNCAVSSDHMRTYSNTKIVKKQHTEIPFLDPTNPLKHAICYKQRDTAFVQGWITTICKFFEVRGPLLKRAQKTQILAWSCTCECW